MPRPAPGQGIKVNFVTREGETVTVEANEGESLLDLARANDLDVEGASLFFCQLGLNGPRKTRSRALTNACLPLPGHRCL